MHNTLRLYSREVGKKQLVTSETEKQEDNTVHTCIVTRMPDTSQLDPKEADIPILVRGKMEKNPTVNRTLNNFA